MLLRTMYIRMVCHCTWVRECGVEESAREYTACRRVLKLPLHEFHCRECYGVVEITEFSLSSGCDWNNG